MTTNLKPADELKSIRDRIKELQAREREIRDGLVAGELDTVGNLAIAFLTKQKSTRFDRKAAEEELGDLSRFDRVSEVVMVRVQERYFEEEQA